MAANECPLNSSYVLSCCNCSSCFVVDMHIVHKHLLEVVLKMLTLFVPKGGKGQRCNSILNLLKQFANTQTYQVEVVVEI